MQYERTIYPPSLMVVAEHYETSWVNERGKRLKLNGIGAKCATFLSERGIGERNPFEVPDLAYFTIVSIDPCIVIAFERVPPGQFEVLDESRMVGGLDRSLLYGTVMLYKTAPWWFSPDLGVSSTPTEECVDGSRYARWEEGCIVLNRERGAWVATRVGQTQRGLPPLSGQSALSQMDSLIAEELNRNCFGDPRRSSPRRRRRQAGRTDMMLP